jgi:hypothetical protein
MNSSRMKIFFTKFETETRIKRKEKEKDEQRWHVVSAQKVKKNGEQKCQERTPHFSLSKKFFKIQQY